MFCLYKLTTASIVLLLVSYLLFSSKGELKCEPNKQQCRDVKFTVTASANVLDLSPWSVDTLLNTPIADLFGDGSTLNFNLTVTGTFDIAASYCEPHSCGGLKEGHVPKDILQILTHGSSYTSAYWSGSGTDGASYTKHAGSSGYATLAIDRLGRGKSSLPDPKSFLQYSFEAEVIHQIIQQIRRNTSQLPGDRFKHIVYVGHAYGSIIGVNLAKRYPQDVDALILTSYSSTYNRLAFGGNPMNQIIGPASAVDPVLFPGYTEGYTVIRTIDILRNIFYYPTAFSPTDLARDFQTRGVIGIGEIATADAGLTVAEGYKGAVLVATAQHDLEFCGRGLPETTVYCGTATEGPVAKTKEQFPSAKNFEVYIVPEAASTWLKHHIAVEGITRVLAWLDGVILE